MSSSKKRERQVLLSSTSPRSSSDSSGSRGSKGKSPVRKKAIRKSSIGNNKKLSEVERHERKDKSWTPPDRLTDREAQIEIDNMADSCECMVDSFENGCFLGHFSTQGELNVCVDFNSAVKLLYL